MCGIAGFFSLGKLSPEQKEGVYNIMTRLFDETKSRGTDASGFSYINNHNELVTVKGPVTSQSIIKDRKWVKLQTELPDMLIAHCRAMTKGSPMENFNNHPITHKKEMAVIHNGCIGNDDVLKTRYTLPAKGEVDSEVIPLMIQKNLDDLASDNGAAPVYLDIAKAINMASQEIYGSYACGMINTKTPSVLYLFNHVNPLVLDYCPKLNTIFFSSTKSIMEAAFKQVKKWNFFALPEYEHTPEEVPNDTIVVLRRRDEKPVNVTPQIVGQPAAETPAELDGVKEKFTIHFYEMNSSVFRNSVTTYVAGKIVDVPEKVSRVLKLKAPTVIEQTEDDYLTC